MNPNSHPTRRARLIGSLVVLNGVALLLSACSFTEGRVALVGGPPRVAVVNSPVKPTQVIEGVVEHEADADCFVLTDHETQTQYAIAWPMNSEGGYSANQVPGVHLERGETIMSGSEVIASGEVEAPGSKQAAELPELSPLCGVEDGGWMLFADLNLSEEPG